MIDVKRAKEELSKNGVNSYREHDGTISYTIWKSAGTPDIYYWYTIQDVPRKKSLPVNTLYESAVFYNLDDLFVDFERGDDE